MITTGQMRHTVGLPDHPTWPMNPQTTTNGVGDQLIMRCLRAGLVPLIHQCWAHSPANRPGIVQVCTHLEEIRQRCLEQIHQISNKRLRTSHGRGERFGDVLTGGAVLEHANRQIASVFQSAQMAKNLAFEVISLLRRAEQPEIQMQGALVIAATCGQVSTRIPLSANTIHLSKSYATLTDLASLPMGNRMK